MGVDLTPFKTCSYDCIYCQIGKTTKWTLARREYVPVKEVLEEVRAFLAEKIPFDEVREQLVKEETSKHRSQVIDAEIARIGKLEGIETDQQVIETLVVKPDYEKIKALEVPKTK